MESILNRFMDLVKRWIYFNRFFEYKNPFYTWQPSPVFVRESHLPRNHNFSGRFFALCAITSRAAQHLVVCDSDSPFISFFPPPLAFAVCSSSRAWFVMRKMSTFPSRLARGGWAWHVGHSNEAALHMQHVYHVAPSTVWVSARNLGARLGHHPHHRVISSLSLSTF